jgi:hypothetical protein
VYAGCQNCRKCANHFRLTPTKSLNTEKLFSSPSRDRGQTGSPPSAIKRHADSVVVGRDSLADGLSVGRRAGAAMRWASPMRTNSTRNREVLLLAKEIPQP